jgi:hypothetical protein
MTPNEFPARRRRARALSLGAISSGIAGLVIAVWGVLDRGPHRVGLVDTHHLWVSARWVLITAVLAPVAGGVVLSVRRHLTSEPRRITTTLAAFAVMIAAGWTGVRGFKRLGQDAESLSGPGPAPSTGVLVVALALAIVSLLCAAAAAVSWTGIHSTAMRRRGFSIRTIAVATVAVTLVGVGTSLATTLPSDTDYGPQIPPTSLSVTGQTIPLTAATRLVHRIPTRNAQTAIVGGLLVVADDSSVTVRDIATDTVRWSRSRTPLAGSIGRIGTRSTPNPQTLPVDADPTDPTVFVRTGSRIVAIAVRTGEIRWSADSYDAVVLGASRGTVVIAQNTSELKKTEKGVKEIESGTLVALDTRTGKQRWARPIEGSEESTCEIDGAAIDDVVAYDDCEAGWSMRSLRDGTKVPTRRSGGQVRTASALGTHIAVTADGGDRNDPGSVTDLFRPGASVPDASIPGAVASPPVRGIVLGAYKIDGRTSFGTWDIATGQAARMPDDLDSTDFGGLQQREWTAAGDDLVGPAIVNPPDPSADIRSVIAAYDTRTRSAQTIPSPCLASSAISVTPVGSTYVVQCSQRGDGGDKSTVGEIIVLGRG